VAIADKSLKNFSASSSDLPKISRILLTYSFLKLSQFKVLASSHLSPSTKEILSSTLTLLLSKALSKN